MIISPNEINDNLRTVVIAPMTTASKPYPTRVKILHNGKIGWAVIDQIRTIDKSRIIKNLGKITQKEIGECKSILRETFVD